jgi:aspartyl-tRNA(Asn)/glutamyl-tRNA(Gln) amidotransferase subunit A
MILEDFTIETARAGIAEKQFSAFELASAYLDHIAERDLKIEAYLSVDREDTLKQASEIDVRLAKGEELSAVAGIPFAIKDNILIEGKPATAGSRILESYRAPYTATAAKKLLVAGGVILGKTNLDEFAMGTSTEHSAFKITKNPRDLERVPGGSSGGSAAAVAANLAVAALGSDTGGSIRQPAAFCGVVGLKPTYGAVSRYGLIALASSLDQIGPLTKTVRDTRLVFNAIRGRDPRDATSMDAPHARTSLSFKEVSQLTLGLPKEYFGEGIAPEVLEAVEKSIADLKGIGVTCKEISLPYTEHAISAYYIIMPAEAATNLARYDGIRYARPDTKLRGLLETYVANRTEGLGEEPKRRVMLGNFVLSAGHYDAYYKKAQAVRQELRREFADAFASVDAILTPVAPTPAFRIGEKIEDPLAMYLSDVFTVATNLAGLPGLSVPVRGRDGLLPVNFQLIGPAFEEERLLSIGETYERLHGITA